MIRSWRADRRELAQLRARLADHARTVSLTQGLAEQRESARVAAEHSAEVARSVSLALLDELHVAHGLLDQVLPSIRQLHAIPAVVTRCNPDTCATAAWITATETVLKESHL